MKNLSNILDTEPKMIENLIVIIPYLIKFIKYFIKHPLNDENEYMNILYILDVSYLNLNIIL